MQNIKRFFILGLVLVLAGQGCLPGAGAPEAAPKRDGSGGMTAGCNHPYMPLTPGSSITYRSEGTGEATTYTQSITANTGEQATLAYTFEGNEVELDYTINCTDGGIFAEGYIDLSSVNTGAGIRTETRSASGPLLPDNLDVGSSWENDYEMLATFTDPSLPFSEMVQTMHITRTATGRESVTVPAGTFDALVVEASFNLSNDILPGGGTSFTQTEYWVEGVGLVKSEGAGPVGSTSVTQAVSIE